MHILNDSETVLVHGVRTEKISVADVHAVHSPDPDMDVYIKQSLIDRVLAEGRSSIEKRIKQELAAEDSGLATFHTAYAMHATQERLSACRTGWGRRSGCLS